MANGNERLAVIEVHVQHNTEQILDHRHRLMHVDQRFGATEKWVAELQHRVQYLPNKVESLTERQDKTDRTLERIRFAITIIRGTVYNLTTLILAALLFTNNISLDTAQDLLKFLGIG